MTAEKSCDTLSVRDLRVHFTSRRLMKRTEVRAVEGVEFDIPPGETLGLVGESGSGKTTVGRAVVRLVKPTAGVIRFGDTDVLQARGKELSSLRSRIQFVFQDPYQSLNPTMTVEQMLTEPLKVHTDLNRQQRIDRSVELLEQVGLASYHLKRKPLEFSGGQRQRLAISRALAVEPRLLILDEPISSLDVSTQSQVINLLESLQQELGLSYLFIAHDLAVVRHASHRVAVMYRGRLAEIGPAERVCSTPAHPYTAKLLSAIPFPDPERQAQQRAQRKAMFVGAPTRVSDGCSFAARCPHAMDRCWVEVPPLYEVPGGGASACFLHDGDGGRSLLPTLDASVAVKAPTGKRSSVDASRRESVAS